jgi:hypothetical protein
MMVEEIDNEAKAITNAIGAMLSEFTCRTGCRLKVNAEYTEIRVGDNELADVLINIPCVYERSV